MRMRKAEAALLIYGVLALASVQTGASAQEISSAERIRALEEKIEMLRSELEAVKTAQHKQPSATGATVEMAPSPKFTSADKSFSFKLRGRMETDIGFFNSRSGDHDFNDGTELRRARLGMEGTLYRDWLYRLETDFAGASRDDRDGQEVDVKDAFIQYLGLPAATITVGQQKTPNSLERLTSSPSLVFMERAMMVEAFTDRRDAGGDYKAGLTAAHAGENWTIAAGVFGENIAITGNDGADEGYGVNGRATVAPINEAGRLLHLGASGYWRNAGGRGVVRFGDRPEIRVDNTRLVDTGEIEADSYVFGGAELIAALGPAFLQGEYGRTHVARDNSDRDDAEFNGTYITAGYFLTGETLPYKDGIIDRLKPKRNFSPRDGGLGAFAIAARYSTIDLNDRDIRGGEADNFTVGLNWYLNTYLITRLNWIRFDADQASGDIEGDAFAARIGVNW